MIIYAIAKMYGNMWAGWVMVDNHLPTFKDKATAQRFADSWTK